MYGGYEVISEDRPLLTDVLQSADYRTADLHSNPYLLEKLKSRVIAETGGSRARRTDHRKYIRDGSSGRLYDLQVDPKEKEDIREANPDIVEELAAVLAEHQQRVDETSQELEDVTMDEAAAERLKQLDYR